MADCDGRLRPPTATADRDDRARVRHCPRAVWPGPARSPLAVVVHTAIGAEPAQHGAVQWTASTTASSPTTAAPTLRDGPIQGENP
jgi:hypothetical protein